MLMLIGLGPWLMFQNHILYICSLHPTVSIASLLSTLARTISLKFPSLAATLFLSSHVLCHIASVGQPGLIKDIKACSRGTELRAHTAPWAGSLSAHPAVLLFSPSTSLSLTSQESRGWEKLDITDLEGAELGRESRNGEQFSKNRTIFPTHQPQGE